MILYRRQFIVFCLTLGSALCSVFVCLGDGSQEQKRSFKMPEGNAASTLKKAAKQARVDIVFSAEFVKGVRTLPIKGEFTAIEAFNLMLRDSPFVAVRHSKSGVYLIEKKDRSVENSDSTASSIIPNVAMP